MLPLSCNRWPIPTPQMLKQPPCKSKNWAMQAQKWCALPSTAQKPPPKLPKSASVWTTWVTPPRWLATSISMANVYWQNFPSAAKPCPNTASTPAMSAKAQKAMKNLPIWFGLPPKTTKPSVSASTGVRLTKASPSAWWMPIWRPHRPNRPKKSWKKPWLFRRWSLQKKPFC